MYTSSEYSAIYAIYLRLYCTFPCGCDENHNQSLEVFPFENVLRLRANIKLLCKCYLVQLCES